MLRGSDSILESSCSLLFSFPRPLATDDASAVVYMPNTFDLSAHPLCRLIIVRAVDDLNEALDFMHPGI